MAGFDHQVLTDVGWDALADAQSAKKLTFVHMSAGDGTVASDVEMQGLTNLKNRIIDFPITSFSDDGKGQVTLIGTLSSKNVTTGFSFRECGVFATIDTGPELLYCISNAYAQADWIPSKTDAAVVIQSVQIICKIDRVPNMVVNIVAGGDVTAQNIGVATIGPGPFRDKIGQILNLKRFRSPLGTLQLADSGNTIDIDIKTLAVNLDLYVSKVYTNVAPNFSTPQKALDYLMQYTIPSNITATVHFLGEAFPISTSDYGIFCSHPQSSQIKIVGAAPKTVAVSAVTNVNTNSFNVTVASTTGLYVNQCVLLKGGALDSRWRGGHTILAIAGNVVTLKKQFQGGIDYTTGQTGAFQLQWCESILNCAIYGFILKYGIGSIENVTVIGTGQQNAAIFQQNNYPITIKNVIFTNFSTGHNGTSQLFTDIDVCMFDCSVGIALSAGKLLMQNGDCYLNGNIFAGVWLLGGALGYIGVPDVTKPLFIAHIIGNQIGVRVDVNSSAFFNNVYIYINSYGIQSLDNSEASLGRLGTTYPIWNYLNGTDVYAQNAGVVFGSKAGGLISTYSPPLRTVGNDQAYISVS